MDKKELKNRALLLSYYLKFIQADLDYVDDREIALQLNLLYLLPAGIEDWPRIAKQHEHWFGDLKTRKERSAPTYVKIGERKLETKEFLKARTIQKKLRGFLFKIMDEKWGTFDLMPKAKIVLLKERIGHVKLISELTQEDWDSGLAGDTSHIPQSFQIRYFPLGKGDLSQNIAVLNFASVLNGLPIDSIQRCKECHNYFVNLSKRKKVYCDIKCAWKNHARSAREELKKHPRKYKAYLKSQREIMKKAYDKQKKSELGPNVKIKKRPRKKRRISRKGLQTG